MNEHEGDALWYGLTLLPTEIQQRVSELIHQGKSKEEFVSALLIGPCPNCGSEKTRDGEDTGIPTGQEMGDTTVGVCLECGYLWCLTCGVPLSSWPCPHWTICDSCDDSPTEEEMEQGESCPYVGREKECPKLRFYRGKEGK